MASSMATCHIKTSGGKTRQTIIHAQGRPDYDFAK